MLRLILANIICEFFLYILENVHRSRSKHNFIDSLLDFKNKVKIYRLQTYKVKHTYNNIKLDMYNISIQLFIALQTFYS